MPILDIIVMSEKGRCHVHIEAIGLAEEDSTIGYTPRFFKPRGPRTNVRPQSRDDCQSIE